MNGFNIAEAGHTVLALVPETISGGATAQAFSMKGAEHVSIIIAFGVVAGSPPTPPTSIVINQCSSAAGANATALGSFRYYYQTAAGAGNDILNGYQQCLSNSPNLPPNYTSGTAGITTVPAINAPLPAPNPGGGLIVIEIDAAELEAAADAVGPQTELPYLQVVIANGAYATYACVLAILSGQRYSYKVGVTATT